MFKKERYDFAFLVHPRGFDDIKRKFPLTKHFPKSLVLFILRFCPPIKVATIKGLLDKNGEKRNGIVISIPLVAEEMLDKREVAKQHVMRAIKFAHSLGARHVGLGALTSTVTNGGMDVKNFIQGTHITNGNALTSHITYLGIKEIIKKKKPSAKNLSIVGATGSIGSAVSELLVRDELFEKIFIVGRTPSRIKNLLATLQGFNKKTKVYDLLLEKALSDSDVVLMATSASGAIISSAMLKNGAVIYDITQPKNTTLDIIKERADVLLYDGGFVKVPKNVIVKGHLGAPKGHLFACMAETMLLSLEGHPDDFCLGNVKVEQVEYVSRLTERYNFLPADLKTSCIEQHHVG